MSRLNEYLESFKSKRPKNWYVKDDWGKNIIKENAEKLAKKLKSDEGMLAAMVNKVLQKSQPDMTPEDKEVIKKYAKAGNIEINIPTENGKAMIDSTSSFIIAMQNYLNSQKDK
jgi:hypothetical protein